MKLKRIKEIIKEEVDLFLLEEQLDEIADSRDWLLRRPLKEWVIFTKPGTELKSVRSFRPVYHGHRIEIKAGFPFEVIGEHPPGDQDEATGVPVPIKPADRGPKADKDMFNRIRLIGLDGPYKGGRFFVNPFEYKKFFEESPDDYRSNPEMPGEALPPGEEDPRYSNQKSPMVVPQPHDPGEDYTQPDRPLRKAKAR
jgi:hypothetical protein